MPPAEARKAYVLLPDGTPARRLKPTLQGERRYWNLAIEKNGKTRRVPEHKLHEFCDPLPANPNR